MRGWCIVFILLFSHLHAQMIRVNIEPDDRLSSFIFQPLAEEAVVMTTDSVPVELFRLQTLDQLQVQLDGDKVALSRNGKSLGRYSSIIIYSNDEDPRFNILSGSRNPIRTYYDNLEIRPAMTRLLLINVVYLENYIRGVIYAEAGHHKSLDFFKVQAVSARTYAINHAGRHGSEGYDLCDKQHCQAYHGVMKNSPLIEKAVQQTVGEVLLYGENELVEAVFSANCGGFTANSEDVWVSKKSYLRATPDDNYCEGFHNHAWHLLVGKQEMLEKLGKYHGIEAESFEIIYDVSGRVRKMILNNDSKYSISGEEIRRLLKIKSSKFYIYESRNLLFIEGAGFGHGVGMCQDGAFYLSEMGLDYEKILEHYYQGVTIARLAAIWNLIQPEH